MENNSTIVIARVNPTFVGFNRAILGTIGGSIQLTTRNLLN